MTTLSPVAGASGPSASVAAKGSTPEPGFQAAFNNAAAQVPPLSGPVQPGKNDKSRKPTDKEDDASPAKQDEPSQVRDGLLSFLVAPTPDLLSKGLPLQTPSGMSAVLSPGSTDAGTHLPQAAAVDGVSILPAASTSDPSAKPADMQDAGNAKEAGKSGYAVNTPTAAPFGSAGPGVQTDVLAAPRTPQAEARIESPDAQLPHNLSAANAAQQAHARTAMPAGDNTPAQLPSTLQTAATASVPAQSQTTDLPVTRDAAQALPRPVASPTAVAGASKTAQPSSSSNPFPQGASGPHKPDSATPVPTGAATGDSSKQGSAKSESSPTKKDGAGSIAPISAAPAQVVAANNSAAAPPAVLPGISSGIAAPHESSGAGISGALPASESAAVHSPEPNAAAPALPQINTARVLGSMGSTELRVGMHSQEFGSVSIATSVSPGGIAAQIALDHGDLSKALAAHLPGIEEKLGHTLGVQARVEVFGTGTSAGFGGSAPREGAGGQGHRGFVSSPAISSTARDPYLTQAPPEAGEQAGSGLRLSVRA